MSCTSSFDDVTVDDPHDRFALDAASDFTDSDRSHPRRTLSEWNSSVAQKRFNPFGVNVFSRESSSTGRYCFAKIC